MNLPRNARGLSNRGCSRGLSNRSTGFTLIELILVIVITAALAVFALPKALDTTLWRLRSFGDDLVARHQAMLRLALQHLTLGRPSPCFLCAETLPWRCHRRLIADLAVARGVEVVHLLGPGAEIAPRPFAEAEVRDGRLYLCGTLVA